MRKADEIRPSRLPDDRNYTDAESGGPADKQDFYARCELALVIRATQAQGNTGCGGVATIGYRHDLASRQDAAKITYLPHEFRGDLVAAADVNI
jgi:hypothetical protein